MSSYKIIYSISNILSRISWHGLPETAAAEMGYRFRTGDMEGASPLVISLMRDLKSNMEMKDIKAAFILLGIINNEMLEEIIEGA